MTLDLSSSMSGLQDRTAPTVQLLYRSRSRNGAASALQMSDILAQARPANARHGITGVLTAVDGQFVQLIEGSESALDRLMANLLADERHDELTVIERRAASRAFGDWDMVSPRLVASELGLLALLLADDRAGIDAHVEVLMRAVATQDAMLEGRSLFSASPRPALDAALGSAGSEA